MFLAHGARSCSSNFASSLPHQPFEEDEPEDEFHDESDDDFLPESADSAAAASASAASTPPSSRPPPRQPALVAAEGLRAATAFERLSDDQQDEMMNWLESSEPDSPVPPPLQAVFQHAASASSSSGSKGDADEEQEDVVPLFDKTTLVKEPQTLTDRFFKVSDTVSDCLVHWLISLRSILLRRFF